VSRFHPDLKLARFLPRTVGEPRLLGVLRSLTELQAGAAGVEVVEVTEDVTVRVHRPSPGGRDPAPGVLYVHGGGYVLGTAAMGDPFCRPLASHLDVVVAAVDYRLAPEHPYPTPLEDTYAALSWLAARPEVDADRLALVGESAGGGLAAGLALLARARGEIAPVLQVLTYPMLDDRTTDGGLDRRHLRVWNRRSNRFGWDAYLGDLRGGEVPPTAAPGRAEDLSGLPPTWLGVGTRDLFHAENVAFARRLREAGVPCELYEVEGAYHGFDTFERRAEVSRAFQRARIGALRAALAEPG
jgi:acetyl esterase/lipase